MIAFCSAWSPRHNSWRWPLGISNSSRRQPTSLQCGTSRGAPLYPVARRVFSLTRTAPTLRRRQVERFANGRPHFAYAFVNGIDHSSAAPSLAVMAEAPRTDPHVPSPGLTNQYNTIMGIWRVPDGSSNADAARTIDRGSDK